MSQPSSRQPASTFCPVPKEQQPLQEYEALKAAWLFNWTVQPLDVYIRKLSWVALWSGLFLAPLAAASFAPDKWPVQFTLVTGGAALIMVVLLLIRLLLGWIYVRDRLCQDAVVYEESGWYDGQRWQKPPEVLARDRLVVTYQIEPILQRLYRSFLTCGLLWAVGAIAWLIA